MQFKNSRLWVEHKFWVIARDSMAILGAAFLVRYAMHTYLEPYAPFHFFIIACLLIAIRYGYRAALLSLLSSVFLGEYFFIAPYASVGEITNTDLIQVFNFVLVTVISIVVIEKLQRNIYSQKLLIKIMEDRHRSMLVRKNALTYKLRSTLKNQSFTG